MAHGIIRQLEKSRFVLVVCGGIILLPGCSGSRPLAEYANENHTATVGERTPSEEAARATAAALMPASPSAQEADSRNQNQPAAAVPNQHTSGVGMHAANDRLNGSSGPTGPARNVRGGHGAPVAGGAGSTRSMPRGSHSDDPGNVEKQSRQLRTRAEKTYAAGNVPEAFQLARQALELARRCPEDAHCRRAAQEATELTRQLGEALNRATKPMDERKPIKVK